MRRRAAYHMGWVISALTHGAGAALAAFLFTSVDIPVPPITIEIREALSAPVSETPSPTPPIESTAVPPVAAPAPRSKVHTAVSRRQPVQRETRNEEAMVTRQFVQTNQEILAEPVTEQSPVVARAEPREVREAVSEPAVQQAEAIHQAPAIVERKTANMPEAISEPSQFSQAPVPEEFPQEARAVVEPAPEVTRSEESRVTDAAAVAHLPAVETVPAPAVVQRPVHDYGWLSAALRARIEALKRYPSFAKARRWEGRVVIEADVRDTGDIVRLQVAESSGYALLDDEAMAVVRKASPVPLHHQLGQPYITIRIPIAYQLHS